MGGNVAYDSYRNAEKGSFQFPKLGVYRGIMWGYIGIMEKKMEAAIRDSGFRVVPKITVVSQLGAPKYYAP